MGTAKCHESLYIPGVDLQAGLASGYGVRNVRVTSCRNGLTSILLTTDGAMHGQL
jgi:hypothetical protein